MFDISTPLSSHHVQVADIGGQFGYAAITTVGAEIVP